MGTNKRKIINDPVYDGFLTIEDEIVYDVLSHPYFQRLRRIKQLGYTCLVYPGAVHTRFSHMLGALNLMNRALDVLAVKGVEMSREEVLGARLAILLHDIGHGPFSHTSEYMIADLHHEHCTRLFMKRLNEEFGGGLDTAISIFDDSYPKHFLHQLVSSQLDVDRLDYLGRDSFFTGVSEGIVGTDRIISMLNVKDDRLVVEEKGIYSVEKFIISRRLMYWQVYLHKAVVAADTLLMNILRRAREVAAQGVPLGIEEQPLNDFLTHHYTQQDFADRPELLDRFAQLDDSDIDMAVKRWMSHSDKVLRILSEHLTNRMLSAIRVSDQPFAEEEVERLRAQSQAFYGIAPHESEYFVNTSVLKNHAYDYNDQEISVLFKDGTCRDIGDASDQLDRHFLEKQVTKYYLYFPKTLIK
ncbi:MAG: HD domain-containing protein [Bacteroidales bacterium]|nr:HD domain-containing protein [Bacteroidales bacterium]